MPKINLDLGRNLKDSGPVEIDMDEVHYPSFHVESDKKIDFPSEGEMTIKFKKVSSSMSERENGRNHYSCTVEVRKITEIYPEEDNRPSKRDTSTEEALDSLAKVVSKRRSKNSDSY